MWAAGVHRHPRRRRRALGKVRLSARVAMPQRYAATLCRNARAATSSMGTSS